MPFPEYQPHRPTEPNPDLDAVQLQIELLVAEIRRQFPIGNGRLVDFTLPANVDTLVEHGLNRAAEGYILVQTNEYRSVPQISTLENPDETKYLYLFTNRDTTGRLWVF